jgi:hypothetical protein
LTQNVKDEAPGDWQARPIRGFRSSEEYTIVAKAMNPADQLHVANIQRPFFEYRATFTDPITPFWYGTKQGEVIGTMLKALSDWHLSLENISWNQAAKNLGEAQVTFAVPSLFASIQLGIGGITTTAINPDWSRVSQFIALFQTAVDALRTVVMQEFTSQQTTLGFHVLPNSQPFREALLRFVDGARLGAKDAKMFGVSAYYNDFSFVIDGSAVFPESVFIKLIRTYPPTMRFEAMAGTMYSDEERILGLLGLKLQ